MRQRSTLRLRPFALFAQDVRPSSAPKRALDETPRAHVNGFVGSRLSAPGRLAQRESTPFTREGSQVQSLCRPPFSLNLFKGFRFALSLVPQPSNANR